MIVAQDDIAIEVRSRDDAGGWTSRVFHPGEQARLVALACGLDVDIIYREARKNLRP